MNLGLAQYLISAFGRGDLVSSAFYLFALPVAGVAIYRTNRWSYPIYLSIISLMMVLNFLTWLNFPEYFGLGSLILSYTINLGVVSYFLIPEVRNVYFNPRIRWWESKPRYDVEIPASTQMGEIHRAGVIQNISEGGAFIQTDSTFLAGNEIALTFEPRGKKFALSGKVIYPRNELPKGYGIQFNLSHQEARELKDFIQELKLLGAHERLGDSGAWAEFKDWFVTAVSTGQGLVPKSRKKSRTQNVGIGCWCSAAFINCQAKV